MIRKYFIGLLAALLLVTTAGCGVVQDDERAVCTVSDKSATKDPSTHSTDYRIYTEDCGTFQVADSLTRKTFRSADTYGKIKIGHTYEFTYHGWRNGLLSMFPNITEAVEIDQ